MPSNLELKRSLEQARKENDFKTKTIAELNEKLSKFLELESSNKVNTIESPLLSPLNSPLEIPVTNPIASRVGNVEEHKVNTEITSVETLNDLSGNKTSLKKKNNLLVILLLKKFVVS